MLTIERTPTVSAVPPLAWDRLTGESSPFLEHGFLSALEDAACVGPEAGWHPRYLLAHRGGDLVGALPLFRKDHSQGEFIFDWGWAEAAARAGLPYYPKMVVAAPFSPVSGARILLAPGEGDEVRRALLEAAREATVDEPGTGLHLLYVTEPEARFLGEQGLAIRHTHQFHWHNEGYRDFDDYLDRFRSKRRNQIRRERRRVREAGVEIRVIEGDAISPAHMDVAWRFYTSTVDKYFWGQRYLNRYFFDLLYQRCRRRLLLVFAERDGQTLAGTVNLRKGGVLYGRYWGAAGDVPNLHFEVCSYAGIEAAIARGIERFEPGAGGGSHKFGRGFLPVVTRSAHEIYVPALDRAVRPFLRDEQAALAAELDALEGRVLKSFPT